MTVTSDTPDRSVEYLRRSRWHRPAPAGMLSVSVASPAGRAWVRSCEQEWS